jgi:DNA-binding CsgD family transcriptional regulator
MAGANRFTAREAQILHLIARGLTDKEVALQLGISQKTVSTHLCRLYLRRHLHSRAAAVMAWLESRDSDVVWTPVIDMTTRSSQLMDPREAMLPRANAVGPLANGRAHDVDLESSDALQFEAMLEPAVKT